MKDFVYFANCDAVNETLFEQYGTKNDDYIYICCLCGCKTNISGSISVQGYRLICNDCAMTKFNSVIDAMLWIHGGYYD